MTLTYLPNKLPTLEPVKRALIAAINADLASALDYVTQASPRPDISVPVPLPENVLAFTKRDYTAVTAWPTIAIETEDLAPHLMNEQLTGMLRCGVGIDCWLRHQDGPTLDTYIDRYGAALWVLLANYDRLAGTALDIGSFQVQPDPSGGTLNARVARVSIDALVRL